MTGPGQGSRRFTIADGMALIAATAAGIAVSSRVSPDAWREPWSALSTWKAAVNFAAISITMAMPCLIAWTVAVPLLRMRDGLPRWRRAARRPGIAACLSVWLSLPAVTAILLGCQVYARGFERFWDRLQGIGAPSLVMEVLIVASPMVGLSVAIAWGLQAIQGRWRAEVTWTDRAGRVLGTFWIIIVPVVIVDLIVKSA
jgi:hypothetical protein